MSRMHMQIETPKYEKELPAYCKVQWPSGDESTAILWESYVDHRTSGVVYLCSVSCRTFMLPEAYIDPNTVMHMPIAKIGGTQDGNN